MKSKLWTFTLLISAAIIGGCSASGSDSDGNAMDNSNMTEEEMADMEGMDHSNMTEEDMANMEGMDMENGDASHTNQLALNNSTGENELALPPLVEPKDGIVDITAQQGTTEIFKGVQTETLGYNGSFLGPVIRINKGEKVTFRTGNEMSEPTTFHWHGVEIPEKAMVDHIK